VLFISWLITPYTYGDRQVGTLVLFHTPEPPQDTAVPPGPMAQSLSELQRLALLAETTTRLTSTFDIDEALKRLATLVVPRLADWVVVDLIAERDEVWRTVVVRADGDTLVRREDLEGPMPPIPEQSPMPLSRALRGVSSTLAGPQTYQGTPDSGIA